MRRQIFAMMIAMSEKFSGSEGNWQNNLELVRNEVRQELVSRQLSEHLPSPSQDVRILDVGSGQGTQANRLAGLGYSVTGIDPSDELLEIAASSSTVLENQPKFLKGTLENVPEEAGRGFDIVCCHGVLMYLPDLESAIGELVSLARPGGLVSVLTRNRAGIAMRAGMLKDWSSAIHGFDARHFKNRLGIEDVRADEPGEVIAAFEKNGSELVTWYGVRLFTDHWEDRGKPKDFELLVQAEFEAGRRDPYRQLTSLTHVIAKVA